jgi:hypothetical protein
MTHERWRAFLASRSRADDVAGARELVAVRILALSHLKTVRLVRSTLMADVSMHCSELALWAGHKPTYAVQQLEAHLRPLTPAIAHARDEPISCANSA